jgi:hypothetical protein
MNRHLINDPFLKNLSEKELYEIATRIENWGLNTTSFEETVSRWFGNFNANDKELALKIFSNIDYFNPARFSERLIELFSSVKQYIFERGISQQNIVIGVPTGQGDSAHRHAYDSHKIWGLSLNQISTIEELYQRDLTGYVLVLFNDTHGTGNQFLRDVWEKVKKLPNPPQETVVLAINIAKQALKNFREKLPNVFVIPDIATRSAESIFTANEFERLRLLGSKVYPEHPLGYGDTALLTAYYFQCPNNTLPIIWADGINNSYNNQEGYPWYPLFPYIPKKKDSRKSFFQSFQIEIKEQKPASQSSQLVNSNPANKNFFDKYFKYKKRVTDVTPKDILDYRFKSFDEFYYERQIDEEIFQKVQNGENILIVGNPLSGKTRAVYELIVKLKETDPDAEILVPKMTLTASSFDNLRSNYKQFVFFDDIDDYYNTQNNDAKNVDKFIIELAKSGFQTIATCRIGPEFKDFKTNSSFKVKEILSANIKIEKIKRNKAVQLAEARNIDLEEKEFDGNIGSIFLPIEKMRERYAYLSLQDNDISRLSLNFLKTLKALYISSNFYTKSKYSLEKIEDYCIRLSVGRHAVKTPTSSSIFKQQMLQAMKILEREKVESFYRNKDAALENLQSDNENLNFITIDTVEKTIRVEEVYLERIVKYHTIEIINHINDFYEANEKLSSGFFVKTSHFNSLIGNSKSFDDARKLITLMKKEGVKPNPDTFAMLIRKAENFKDAEEWLQKALINENINIQVFGEIIKKSPNRAIAFTYFKEVFERSENNFEITESSISWIVACYIQVKSENSDWEEVFDLLEENNIALTDSIINSFITNAKSLSEAFCILEESLEKNLTPDTRTLNSLIEKITTLDEGFELIDRFTQFKVSPDSITFHTLLKKIANLEEAVKCLKKAEEYEVDLDSNMLNQIVLKVYNIEDGFKLIEEATRKNTVLNSITFNNLIMKASSVEEGFKVIDKAIEQKISLDYVIFSNLIDRVDTLENGFKIIDKAKEYNIKFQPVIFNNLMDRAKTFDEAKKVLLFSKDAGQEPSKYLLTRVLSKCATILEGYDVINTYDLFKEFPLLNNIKIDIEADFNKNLEKINQIFNLKTFYSNKKILANHIINEMIKSNLIDNARRNEIIELFNKFEIHIYKDIEEYLTEH